MKYSKFIYIVFVLIVPAFAQAAAEGHAPDYKGFFWRIFIFVLFVLLMKVLLQKRLSSMLGASVADIEKRIADANSDLAIAKAELEEYAKKNAAMESELEEMRETARKSAENLVLQMMANAEKDVDRVKDYAKMMIQTETQKAIDEVRAVAVDEAFAQAEEALKKNLDSAAQIRIVREDIKKIGA